MTKTYDPELKRYVADPIKDYSRPSPEKVEVYRETIATMQAKLDAIAECTTMDEVKLILI